MTSAAAAELTEFVQIQQQDHRHLILIRVNPGGREEEKLPGHLLTLQELLHSQSLEI